MYDRILTRNNKFFRDIVKGEYGRRVLYTDAEEITNENILRVISECVGDFYWNRMVINYLWHYYKGDQPILYRTKVSRDLVMMHGNNVSQMNQNQLKSAHVAGRNFLQEITSTR